MIRLYEYFLNDNYVSISSLPLQYINKSVVNIYRCKLKYAQYI